MKTKYDNMTINQLIEKIERLETRKPIFASEQEAIAWVRSNTPFAVKAIKKAKTIFVIPFASRNAERIVIESLGKELYELIKSNYEIHTDTY